MRNFGRQAGSVLGIIALVAAVIAMIILCVGGFGTRIEGTASCKQYQVVGVSFDSFGAKGDWEYNAGGEAAFSGSTLWGEGYTMHVLCGGTEEGPYSINIVVNPGPEPTIVCDDPVRETDVVKTTENHCTVS